MPNTPAANPPTNPIAIPATISIVPEDSIRGGRLVQIKKRKASKSKNRPKIRRKASSGNR